MPARLDWTPELEDAICNRLIQGDSIRTICADDSMPGMTSIFKHLSESNDFAKQYAHAREQQAENYANQIIDIADETPTCEVPDPDGGTSTRIDAAGIQRNKLRVDARKWIACKLLPKVYGEKQEISGPNGGAIQIISTIPRPPKETE